jgi:hypothetical protein
MGHASHQRHQRCQPDVADPGYFAKGTHRVTL